MQSKLRTQMMNSVLRNPNPIAQSIEAENISLHDAVARSIEVVGRVPSVLPLVHKWTPDDSAVGTNVIKTAAGSKNDRSVHEHLLTGIMSSGRPPGHDQVLEAVLLCRKPWPE